MSSTLRPVVFLFALSFITLAPTKLFAAGEPVASYNFDQGSGTTLTDTSGRGNTGTVSGATWTTSGRNGGALSFDGVNDRVNVPDSNSLDLTTAMTLEAWVYPTQFGTSYSGWRSVVIKQIPSQLSYALYANSDTNRPSTHVNMGSGDIGAKGPSQLPLNTWTHLTSTYDGGVQRLYVNGVQVGTVNVSGSLATSSNVLSIGGNTLWSEYFSGRIDDIRIYNRALSAQEIQTDMNTPVGLPAPDTASPTVTMTAPAAGSSFWGATTLTATASDNVSVAGVQFLLDGAVLGTEDTTAPYSLSWDASSVTPGSHTLSARARDAAGNTATATNITVTVQSPPGPVLGYALNDGSGTVAVDASQSGNTGTLINGPTWTSGKNAQALQFDGTNDYIEAPHSTTLNITGNKLALSGWIYPTTSSGTRMILGKPTSATQHTSPFFSYSLYTVNGAVRFYIRTGSTNRTLTTSATLPANTWSHVAAVYNGTTMKIYINAVESATLNATGNLPTYTTPLRIGANGARQQTWQGRLDDIRIYNRDLSLAEIQSNMNTPVALPDVEAPSVPANLSVSVISPTQIDLSWQASTDNVAVTGYTVYRNGAELAIVSSGTSYQNTGLTPETTYTYTVAAFDAGSNVSAQSEAKEGRTLAPPDTTIPNIFLTTPDNNAAVSGQVSVLADASDNVGVVGVKFLVDGVLVGEEDIEAPYGITWDTTTATEGAHSLTASARDAAGNVTISGARQVTVDNISVPQPTVTLVANPQTVSHNGSTTLTWTSTDATSCVASGLWNGSHSMTGEEVVQTLTTSGNFTLECSGPESSATATVAVVVLPPPTQCADNVDNDGDTVVDLADPGCGDVNDNDETDPDTTAPTVPSDLSVSVVSQTELNLSWTASTDSVGVTGYRVERCQGVSCTNFTQVSSPTTTTLNDTGLTANTTYRYQVRAADAANNLSSYSSIVNGTTEAAPVTPTWTRATQTGSWPYRRGFTFGLYDPTLRKILYHGSDNGNSIYGNGLWGYDPGTARWQQITDSGTTDRTCPSSANHPEDRHPYKATAYDTTRNRLYMFGGAACHVAMTDTWYFSSGSSTWTKVNPSANPGDRYDSAGVYLPTQDVFMLYGGIIGGTRNDTWYYSPTSNQWTQQSVTGNPPYRGAHGMVYDSLNNRVVVFGGYPTYGSPAINEVWLYNPTTRAWSNPNPSNRPAATDSVHLAYDSNRGRVLYYGGPGQLHAYNVATNQWTNLNVTGGPQIYDGVGAAMGYDPVQDAMAVFTGNGVEDPVETWHVSFGGATPPADTTPPIAPTNLTVTPASTTQINLSWTASTDAIGVTGYRVERCQGASCTTFTQVGTPTGTTFNDTSLTASTTYRYQVRATDAANNLSSYSSIVNGTTQVDQPTSSGSLFFQQNTANNHDYGRQTVLPENFGNGEFTMELWLKPQQLPIGPTPDGSAEQLVNWTSTDNAPYSSDNWWYKGNFLLDGHNNGNFSQGTFSLQLYGGGHLRWLFGDGQSASRAGQLHAVQAASTATAPDLLDGNWHQVTLVRRFSGASSATLELWIDGVLIDTETSNGRTNMRTYWDNWSSWGNQAGWFWGAEKQAALGGLGGQYEDYKGLVDEVRYWSRAKTTSEISTGYLEPVNGTETGLVGRYSFKEGSDTSACNDLASTQCMTLIKMKTPYWSTENAPLTGGAAATATSAAPSEELQDEE